MYKKVAEKLYENFVVNTSVAAIQQEKSKYFTVKSTITVSLIEEMLRGGHSIGTYQQQTNQNKLRWICFDFDCKNQNRDELKILKREYVDALISKLEELHISYLLEFSGRRGIHVWIFLDQVITKDLAFTIVTKLRDSFYYKIVMDGRFGLDCFPKTGSGKVNNKYGLQVKLPLSRHQLGTYSYFIDKDEDQFNSVESLDEKFLSNQLTFLEGIKKNSIEQIVDKLAITQKISTENIIKYHKKIFNKFFQIADSLSKTETSTGLGLTIAKEFVKLHNGKIDIISKPANGTTFIITLPNNAPCGKDFCGAELLK